MYGCHGGKAQDCFACGVDAGNTKMMSFKSSRVIGMYEEFPFNRTPRFGLSSQSEDTQGSELIAIKKY